MTALKWPVTSGSPPEGPEILTRLAIWVVSVSGIRANVTSLISFAYFSFRPRPQNPPYDAPLVHREKKGLGGGLPYEKWLGHTLHTLTALERLYRQDLFGEEEKWKRRKVCLLPALNNGRRKEEEREGRKINCLSSSLG